MKNLVSFVFVAVFALLGVNTVFAGESIVKRVGVCGQKATVVAVNPQKVARSVVDKANSSVIGPSAKLTSRQVADLNSVKNNKLAGVFSKSFVVEKSGFQSCKMAKKESNSLTRVAGVLD